MTNKKPGFWNRFATALRLRRRAEEKTDPLPRVGDDGLLLDSAEAAVESDAEVVAPDKALSPLSRWGSKRDQTLAKLQEGYEQVTKVIQEIQNHMAAQGERSERICVSLEQLAGSFNDLPSIAREQSQTLETIAARMETTSNRTQQMAETLSEVPKFARTQSEALIGINRHLEMASEQTVMTSQTLDRIGTAMGALGTASQTQTDRLKMMGAKTDEQMDLLTQTIARQNRRFIMLFVVTVILAVAALGAITFLVLSMQKP